MDEERRRRRRRYLVIAAIITVCQQYMNIIGNAINTLSQTNAILTFLTKYHKNNRCRNYRMTRIQTYLSHTVPRFTNKQFENNFRLTTNAYHQLENRVGPLLKPYTRDRNQVPVRKQLLSTIWLLGTPDSYRSIGERFDLGKSALYYCALRVVRVLCSIASDTIRWPTQAEINQLKHNFRQSYGFPDVLGAVDGSYIYVSEPKEHGSAYNTRKCRHAIVLQAVCKYNLKFIDCFAGYPGSVGDYRIFRNSDIFHEIEGNPTRFFPNNEHILGDKAYPLKSWCLTPYRDNGRLTAQQRHYNEVHAKARSVIERAFALLKGRFRRLKYMEVIRHDLASYYILAACVLHNVCLDVGGEEIDQYINLENNDIVNYDVLHDVHESDVGSAKREYIMQLLH